MTREEVIAKINILRNEYNDRYIDYCGVNEAVNMAIEVLKAEPVRGRWIIAKDVGDCCYRCSKCGFIRDAYILDIGNYCPNCGSRNEEIV